VSGAEALLDRIPRVTLVVGKGGVGKTSVASGLAMLLAARGKRTVVLTTDPAGTLADFVERSDARQGALAPIPLRPNLDLWVIDAAGYRRAFLDKWRDTIASILDRGTYLDRDDIDGLVDAALPGADEIFGLLAIGDLLTDAGRFDRVVIDTAPTGHTLRLLELPSTFRALVALLDAMQDKHRFMVRALTHRYRSDAADAFLTEMHQRVDAIRTVLADRSVSGAILVTRAEAVVNAETARYAAALEKAAIGLIAVVVNALPSDSAAGLDTPRDIASRADAPLFFIPLSPSPPHTLDEAGALLQGLTGDSNARTKTPSATRINRLRTDSPAPGPRSPIADPNPLTIVAGKGGVGKTTVSCALAIVAADRGKRTLLVSTDPAPSIADALGQAVGDEDTPVTGTRNLVARQMDATAAFMRLKEEYRARIDSIFDGLIAHGVDIVHDRAILRDLLSLAPPGVDEVYALSSLGETLADSRFDCIVVDPAPTGHLLRLLDMPPLAVDWTHRLMRLMLKYKEIGGLGEAAKDLLAFAKRTRALDAALHDPAVGGIVEVTLDEPLVRAESERLLGELRARRLAISAVIWNRAWRAPAPLATNAEIRQIVAPIGVAIGVDALRAWSADWRSIY
jgi:arsenite-transporting ATPase